MSFLYPSFLWALTALSIPVIIHLFNFKRYKTVYFSNNRFLQAIQKKSQSFNRLKHWLVLLTRLLALACLVFAFAQPFLPAGENESNSNYASIYIDNSLSMKARGIESNLIDEARVKAIEIIESLPASYKIQIVTNNFDGKQQRYYNTREAIQLIDEVQPSYAFRTELEVRGRILSLWQALEEDVKGKLQVFLLSDFQKLQFLSLDQEYDESLNLTFLKFERANQTTNVAIDSVWFDQPVLQPGFDQNIKTRIRNYGNTELEGLSINLNLNGQLINASEFDLSPQENKELSFVIRPQNKSTYEGKLSIEAEEPFFDNDFYFSFKVEDPIQILVIGSTHKDLFNKLYQDSIYAVTFASLNQLNYGELSKYNLILLNELNSFPSGLGSALKEHLKGNGNIVVIPNLEVIDASNIFLQNLSIPSFGELKNKETKVAKVFWNDELFENVFSDRPKSPQLPKINTYLSLNSNKHFPILELENGSPLVSRFPKSNGQVIVMSTDFNKESGGLARHPIIVPIMLNSALYSQPKNQLYNLAGNESGQQFKRSNNNKDLPLIITVNDQDIIPPQRNKANFTEIFSLPAQIVPGTYEVKNDNSLIGHIAINTDSRESNWDFWTNEELENQTTSQNITLLKGDHKNLGSQINSAYNGYPLWRWFLISALLFLGIEILLLKLWK